MGCNLIETIKYEFSGLKFYLRNIAASRTFQPISEARFGDITISGLSKDRIGALEDLHQQLRDGRVVNYWRKAVLRRKGLAVCGIATNNSGRLLGFDYFYFREGEVEEGIIHEAFIGVVQESRGEGIATAMRKHVALHFADQGLHGISSQIDKDNIPSFRSAVKAGFKLAPGISKLDDPIKLLYNLDPLMEEKRNQ